MTGENTDNQKQKIIDQNKSVKSDWSIKKLDADSRQNLSGFFSLLLEIDKRNNPELYKNKNEEEK